MLPVFSKITTLLLSYDEVTSRVGQNTDYADTDDRFCIRPGQLNEDDPYPGIVFEIRSVRYNEDLAGFARHAFVTLEIRSLSLSLGGAWALRSAIAYNDGTADDSRGLHGANDTTGLLSCQHEGDSGDQYDLDDDSDRSLFVVSSTYQLEVSEGLL